MDLQYNAAQHISLRHRDFRKLCLANFLFALSVYMLLPVLPSWMTDMTEYSRFQMSSAMAAFGVGVFSLGGFSSFLIQKYRRNKVCILAMTVLMACMLVVAYMDQEAVPVVGSKDGFAFVVAIRFLSGAVFGLAYMILNSTLIVDCCESSHRTRANMVSMWSYRLAVGVGPLLGILSLKEVGYVNSLYVSAVVCFAALSILASVKFPFKAPDENVRFFSFDRFFMPRSFPLFITTAAVAVSLGVMFASTNGWMFYAWFVAGLVVVAFMQTVFTALRQVNWIPYLSYLLVFIGIWLCRYDCSGLPGGIGALLIGTGMAALTSRLHIYFIHVGDHCQRGTAQSTYILSFEFGIAAGFALKIYYMCNIQPVFLVGGFLLLSLLTYIVMSFGWLKKNLRK